MCFDLWTWSIGNNVNWAAKQLISGVFFFLKQKRRFDHFEFSEFTSSTTTEQSTVSIYRCVLLKWHQHIHIEIHEWNSFIFVHNRIYLHLMKSFCRSHCINAYTSIKRFDNKSKKIKIFVQHICVTMKEQWKMNLNDGESEQWDAIDDFPFVHSSFGFFHSDKSFSIICMPIGN